MCLPHVNPPLHSFCGSQLVSWVSVAPGSSWLDVIALSERLHNQECCSLGWHNGELRHGVSFTYSTPLIHFCGTLLPVLLGFTHGLLVFWRNLDCWIIWVLMQIKRSICGMCIFNTRRYLLSGRWMNNAPLTISLWLFLAFFRHALCSL